MPHPPGPEGPLRDLPRYNALKAAYPWAIERQLVFGLHIHVAVRGADRALAVLNAVRSYLPDLAALAGNAPLHAGRDTGLASLRPEIAGLLPREGVPPVLGSWDEYAGYLAWGRRGGLFPDEGEPWWEARGHDELGTIELRVPDAQDTVEEAAGVLALGAGLVAWLAERYDAGERCRCTTPSASPTTAGARCATASPARCSTSTAASRSRHARACSR